jgi:hypothetical protein
LNSLFQSKYDVPWTSVEDLAFTELASIFFAIILIFASTVFFMSYQGLISNESQFNEVIYTLVYESGSTASVGVPHDFIIYDTSLLCALM